MRKAPLVNALFGVAAIGEAFFRAFTGDLEAAGHSLIAAGYNFFIPLAVYLPTLDGTENADKEYVNSWGVGLNIVVGLIDNVTKNMYDPKTPDSEPFRNTRSITYATIPAQILLALAANVNELYDKKK